MKRTLAIGDIHGSLVCLETLAKAVDFSKEDRIIFLGDYIDRGPDSKSVIDFLIGMKTDGFDVTFLRGNHEIMMLEARFGGRQTKMGWIGVGGAECIESYGETLDDVPQAHWDFLDSLKPYHETENHIFVHAGAAYDTEMKDQPDYQLFWEFFDFPQTHQSGKKVICGHSSQKNGCPLSVGHAICIDTFAHGPGGWLTCMEVNTEYCWRANKLGKTDEAPLEAIANSESSW